MAYRGILYGTEQMEKKVSKAKQNRIKAAEEAIASFRAPEQQQEEKEDKVNFKLLQGGKADSTVPPGEDWLSKLPDHSLFFVQKSNSATDFSLGLFWKDVQEGKVVRLRSPMLPEAIYVNPIRFTNVYQLYEDMGVTEFKQAKEEVNLDGERDPVEGPDRVE